MFLASAGLSIESKEAATRTVPISLFSGGVQGVAQGSAALWAAQGLSVTADLLLCLEGREEQTNLGLLPSPL